MMTTDSHGNDRDVPPSEMALSPTAEGHLSLLRAYFGFQGYVGVVAVALSPFSCVTIHGNPLIMLPLLVVNTWAAFRTRRLLLERHRDGVWMAGATFAWNLVTARSAGHIGVGAILSGLGVILTANVYRELRRGESSILVGACHRGQAAWDPTAPLAPVIQFVEPIRPRSVVVLALDGHSGAPLMTPPIPVVTGTGPPAGR